MKKILFIGLLFVIGCRDIRNEAGPIIYENGVVESLTYTPSHTYIIDHQRETYIVILKCPSGKFHVEDKKLWGTLSEGDNITVGYRENFIIEYKNGQEISRRLYGISFFNVNKRN